MVRAILPHFLVARINQEPDKRRRNALIDDALAYKGHSPSWVPSFVEHMTSDAGKGAW
jgi:hypothetical protein